MNADTSVRLDPTTAYRHSVDEIVASLARATLARAAVSPRSVVVLVRTPRA